MGPVHSQQAPKAPPGVPCSLVALLTLSPGLETSLCWKGRAQTSRCPRVPDLSESHVGTRGAQTCPSPSTVSSSPRRAQRGGPLPAACPSQAASKSVHLSQLPDRQLDQGPRPPHTSDCAPTGATAYQEHSLGAYSTTLPFPASQGRTSACLLSWAGPPGSGASVRARADPFVCSLPVTSAQRRALSSPRQRESEGTKPLPGGDQPAAPPPRIN